MSKNVITEGEEAIMPLKSEGNLEELGNRLRSGSFSRKKKFDDDERAQMGMAPNSAPVTASAAPPRRGLKVRSEAWMTGEEAWRGAKRQTVSNTHRGDPTAYSITPYDGSEE